MADYSPVSESGVNYIEEVAQIMSVRARGASPVAMIHTYGGQQNVADS